MSPHLSPDAKAIVRAAEAMTEQVRRIVDALTTPVTTPQWEQAEAGRIAADNMLRAVCDVFGGPHQDPIVKARETLVRAERGEAAIERVRGLATRLEEFAENALKTDDRQLYAAIARDLRTQLGDPATGLAQAEATEPGPAVLREQIADAIGSTNLPAWPRSYRLEAADAVLAVILPTTKLLGDLARSADADVQRVISLYNRWANAGPPPLGTSVSRWWDERLAELHAAILPPADQTEGN